MSDPHNPYAVEPRKPLTDKRLGIARKTLDPKRLAELLDYDADTGVFTWRVSRLKGKGMATVPAGSVAGTPRKGYIVIGIDGTQYAAHRLAWLAHHGTWPSGIIDHANGDPSDNRISNLRLASGSENIANAKIRSDNTTGHKGVWYWPARRKWKAYISGRTIGYFATEQEARQAYQRAATAKFGSFARFA